MKLILVGATGLVGSEVLKLALAAPEVAQVVAPVRRRIQPHPKLVAPIVDYDRLPAQEPWWQADAVICALGTTIKTAGSQEAFRKVDFSYPMEVGRLARQHGTPSFVLNSALGADAGSGIFYNRVKGEVEHGLRSLGFPTLVIARPGLIGGAREEFRLGEKIMVPILSLLGPVLPRAWRINPAANIARAMLGAAMHPLPGEHIITSDRMA
ncbi:NAD-dependent dehydratase [Pseudoduganella violaceinigra]|uniref:NAD-dependent dehydratase n=1 Tax=Pseudoduganella violaceinigra TaxID=246602 RepID=UPI000484F910|nr:NAD-dependent dehydratase [Pseudoduganella violaceinigra]